MGEYLNRQLYGQLVNEVDPADLGRAAMGDQRTRSSDHVTILQIASNGIGTGDSDTNSTLTVGLKRLEGQALILGHRPLTVAIRVYSREHVLLPGMYCGSCAGTSVPWYDRGFATHTWFW